MPNKVSFSTLGISKLSNVKYRLKYFLQLGLLSLGLFCLLLSCNQVIGCLYLCEYGRARM